MGPERGHPGQQGAVGVAGTVRDLGGAPGQLAEELRVCGRRGGGDVAGELVPDQLGDLRVPADQAGPPPR